MSKCGSMAAASLRQANHASDARMLAFVHVRLVNDDQTEVGQHARPVGMVRQLRMQGFDQGNGQSECKPSRWQVARQVARQAGGQGKPVDKASGKEAV